MLKEEGKDAVKEVEILQIDICVQTIDQAESSSCNGTHTFTSLLLALSIYIYLYIYIYIYI